MSSESKRPRGRPRLSADGDKTVLFAIRVPGKLRDRLRPVPADEIRYSLNICAARHEQGGILDTRDAAKPADRPAVPPQDAQGPDLGPAPAQVDESAPESAGVAQPDRETTGAPDTESLFSE